MCDHLRESNKAVIVTPSLSHTLMRCWACCVFNLQTWRVPTFTCY